MGVGHLGNSFGGQDVEAVGVSGGEGFLEPDEPFDGVALGGVIMGQHIVLVARLPVYTESATLVPSRT